jgi:DNA polymerase I
MRYFVSKISNQYFLTSPDHIERLVTEKEITEICNNPANIIVVNSRHDLPTNPSAEVHDLKGLNALLGTSGSTDVDALLHQIETNNLSKLYKLEQKLIPSLFRIEQNGMPVDMATVQSLKATYETACSGSQELLHRNLGNINLADAKAVLEALNSQPDIKLPNLKNSTLQSRLPNDLIENYLQYRQYTQYLQLLNKIATNIKDGRIYSNYNQTGTVTGRVTTTNINIQGIPVPVREIFCAKPGHSLVSGDYKQMELRIAASFINDSNLTGDINSGVDVYEKMTRKVRGNSYTSSDRDIAKRGILAIIYGSNKYPMLKQCFLQEYPGFRTWKRTDSILRRKNYNSNPTQKQRLNFPIQSTGADIFKQAVVDVDSTGMHIIALLHDEILLEVPDSRINEACRLLKSAMETTISNVKLTVNISVCKSWSKERSKLWK